MKARKRIRIGDIIEIKTDKGLAYFQFIHNHPKYGKLIRILPGFFNKTPNNFSELVKKPEKFMIFFPLQRAINLKICSIKGNETVPSRLQHFPIFKAGIKDPKTHKVKVWWLWDGEKEWKVGELTKEQQKYSSRGVVNDTMLIQMIEKGYSHEKDI